jgi:hypothetical protein
MKKAFAAPRQANYISTDDRNKTKDTQKWKRENGTEKRKELGRMP